MCIASSRFIVLMLCCRLVEPGIGSASHRPGEKREVGGSRGINRVDLGQEPLCRSQERTPSMEAFRGVLALFIL